MKIIKKISNSVIQKFSNSRTRAFTLIELLVVITIIGILITLVTVAVVPVQRRSRDAKRKAEVNSFLSGINLFKADFKIYPNPTFYLGSYGTVANGGINSNYALAIDVAACDALPVTGGKSQNFTSTGTNPTANELDTQAISLKSGFVSVNHFLICMRYMDRVLTDPKPMSANAWDKYQYRVSYDYGDVVVTSKLENESTDSDASFLFNQTSTLRRYYRGSGSVVRHLDDDSDTYLLGNIYTGNFFSALFAGTITNGKYLYQCLKTPVPADITPDLRVSVEPIIASGTSWVANTAACQNNTGGLSVVDAF